MGEASSSPDTSKVSIVPLHLSTHVAGSAGAGGENQGRAFSATWQGPATFGGVEPDQRCPCCGCLVPLGCQISVRETCPPHLVPLPGVGAVPQKLESYISPLVKMEGRGLRG